MDKATRERFTSAYTESHKLEPRGIAKAWIVVGKDDWPLPIPVVKRGSAWYFDTRAGKEELLNRRIGRNELATIQAALAYVDAQQEYYSRNPQKDKFLQYAQKFVSSGERGSRSAAVGVRSKPRCTIATCTGVSARVSPPRAMVEESESRSGRTRARRT